MYIYAGIAYTGLGGVERGGSGPIIEINLILELIPESLSYQEI
jgi:hypothetical protein